MSDAAEAPTKLAWLDVETTGLDAQRDGLLEIGWRITDLDLNTLHERKWLIWDSFNKGAVNNVMEPFVQEMHTKNNLLMEASQEGLPHDVVAVQMVDWLVNTAEVQSEGKLPISGSSVAMDVNFLAIQLSIVAGLFHYRIIDNSTIKEMCRRYNPALYAQRPELETDHRVFTCLDGTIAEARFYLDNFIFDGRDDV